MSERVRLLVTSISLGGGGAERFAATLLRGLNPARFDIRVCLFRDLVSYQAPSEIPLIPLGENRPWKMMAAVRRLAIEIDSWRPQVVLSNIMEANFRTGLALRKTSVQPRWIARLGSGAPGLPWERLLCRLTYGRVDTFVANSRGVLEELVSRFSVANHKAMVIGNPTDFNLIDQAAQETTNLVAPADRPLIVSAIRLARQKRPDVLIDAFARLRKMMPVELWICGEGKLRSRIQRRIDRNGLRDSVQLLGFQQNPFCLLRQATLFALSSDFEGLPNALIEAQGLGIPAVSTRCLYGADEVIEEGRSGLIVPRGDVAAFAFALKELLDDEPRRRQMALAARERSRRLFALPNIIGCWEELLATGIAGPPPPSGDRVPAPVTGIH